MNFRPIRIALTLSLIVTMMSQPMVGVAFAGSGCESRSERQINCPGCGCCEIKPADDRCCCCKPAENRRTVEVPQATQDVAKADGKIATDCRCGIATPPMDRRHQRESKVDSVKPRGSDSKPIELLAESDPKRFLFPDARHCDTGQLGRHSQHYLGVWRI